MYSRKVAGRACTEGAGDMHRAFPEREGAVHLWRALGPCIHGQSCILGRWCMAERSAGSCMHRGWQDGHARREKGTCIPIGRMDRSWPKDWQGHAFVYCMHGGWWDVHARRVVGRAYTEREVPAHSRRAVGPAFPESGGVVLGQRTSGLMYAKWRVVGPCMHGEIRAPCIPGG